MLKTIFFSSLILMSQVSAEDHDHAHGKEHKEEKGHDHKNEAKEKHDDHGDEHKGEHKEAGHGDEHGEHEENTEGFKLSEKATKNFELSYMDYKAPSVTVPAAAVFRGLSEVNLYRMRNSLYKRIDFKILEKNKDSFKVTSTDLEAGDKIVIKGIGFLRIAEIAASGGISDSHSH